MRNCLIRNAEFGIIYKLLVYHEIPLYNLGLYNIRFMRLHFNTRSSGGYGIRPYGLRSIIRNSGANSEFRIYNGPPLQFAVFFRNSEANSEFRIPNSEFLKFSHQIDILIQEAGNNG